MGPDWHDQVGTSRNWRTKIHSEEKFFCRLRFGTDDLLAPFRWFLSTFSSKRLLICFWMFGCLEASLWRTVCPAPVARRLSQRFGDKISRSWHLSLWYISAFHRNPIKRQVVRSRLVWIPDFIENACDWKTKSLRFPIMICVESNFFLNLKKPNKNMSLAHFRRRQPTSFGGRTRCFARNCPRLNATSLDTFGRQDRLTAV